MFFAAHHQAHQQPLDLEGLSDVYLVQPILLSTYNKMLIETEFMVLEAEEMGLEAEEMGSEAEEMDLEAEEMDLEAEDMSLEAEDIIPVHLCMKVATALGTEIHEIIAINVII